MKRTVLICSLTLSVAVTAAWFGHTYYERHHISTGLKRILTAEMDDHATEADELVYMREARLKVETQKDAELVQSFEFALHAFIDANEIEQRQFQQTMDAMKTAFTDGHTQEYEQVARLVAIRNGYRVAHLDAPKSLAAAIDRAVQEAKQSVKDARQAQQAEADRAKSEKATARKVVVRIRAELGLPTLPGSN